MSLILAISDKFLPFMQSSKTSLTKPTSRHSSAMGIKKPENITLFTSNLPVIAYTTAPVGVIKPPFWCDALRTFGGAYPQLAPTPLEFSR